MTMRANLEAEVNRAMEAAKQAENALAECRKAVEQRKRELDIPSTLTLALPNEQTLRECAKQPTGGTMYDIRKECIAGELHTREQDLKKRRADEYTWRKRMIEKAEQASREAQGILQEKRSYLYDMQKKLTEFVAADSSAARTESSQTRDEVSSLKQLISVQQEQLEMMRQMIAQLTANKQQTTTISSKTDELQTDTSATIKKSTKPLAEFFSDCENDFQKFQKKISSTTYQKTIDLCKTGTSSSLTPTALGTSLDGLLPEIPYINSGTSALHEYAELLLGKMQKLSEGIRSGEITTNTNTASFQDVVSNAASKIETQLNTRLDRKELSLSSDEEVREFKSIESKPMIQTSGASHTATSWLDLPAMLCHQVSKSATSLLDVFSHYVDHLIDNAREYATDVASDCPSYFPRNSPNYWRNNGSHTSLLSNKTENALNSTDTYLLTYTPTLALLGPT